MLKTVNAMLEGKNTAVGKKNHGPICPGIASVSATPTEVEKHPFSLWNHFNMLVSLNYENLYCRTSALPKYCYFTVTKAHIFFS